MNNDRIINTIRARGKTDEHVPTSRHPASVHRNKIKKRKKDFTTYEVRIQGVEP
jgi:hypothetical protein